MHHVVRVERADECRVHCHPVVDERARGDGPAQVTALQVWPVCRRQDNNHGLVSRPHPRRLLQGQGQRLE